jgi:iron(III) transport system permease protein
VGRHAEGGEVRRFLADKLPSLILAVLVTGIAIVPLLFVIDAQFYRETRVGLAAGRSMAAVIDVFTSAEYLRYLGNALGLAAIVTLLSLAIGVGLALIMGRTDMPRKRLWDALITLPLYLSPFTGLMAWIALASPKTGFINTALASMLEVFAGSPQPVFDIWSFSGVVFVMTLFFCPLVYLFTVGSLRGMNTSLEEAARIGGATPLATILRVTLPLCLPAIVASGLLVFILGAEMYTIPGIIGSNAGFTTLPWRIFEDSTAVPVHRAHAAAGGTLLLLVTVLGVWLQGRVTRVGARFVTLGGKGFNGRPLRLGRWQPAALAAILAYVLAADILPFGALLMSSVMKYSAGTITQEVLTAKHYIAFFTTGNMRTALLNTVFLALLTGVICMAMGFVISHLALRKPTKLNRALAFLAVLPVAVPGLVYGLGLVWTFLRTPLYGSIWVLLFAYVAKFLPYGVIVSRTGLLQIHPELSESARMCGASAGRALLAITAPLVKATLAAILFFVMLNAIKELSASVLLYSQDSEVLSVLTWHYMDAGDYQFAAAIGFVQTVIMLAVVYAAQAIFRVRLDRAFGQGAAR